MSDQLEDIFARTRPAAVQTIRPPGADAARVTVRHRRRRRTAVIATVAALTVLGGVGIRMGSPSVQVAEPPASPAQLSELAQVTLGPATGPVAVERHGEVRTGWSASGAVNAGEQTLLAVCVGTGSMTLAVTGVPGSESISKEPIAIARLEVPCSIRPVPVSTRYLISQGVMSVDYTIVDAESAANQAGFAVRVLTSDTGEPLSQSNDRANPTAALHLTEQESSEQFGMGADMERGSELEDDLPAWIGGRFTVAGACAGLGTLKVEIRRATGKTVDSWELPCRWPPKRYDWTPARGSGALKIYVRHEPASDSIAGTGFALQFDPA